MRYFLVNQNTTFKEEKDGNFLWAPIKTDHGKKVKHWDMLLKVHKGDVIFSNVKGKIVSINEALGSCYNFDNPFANQIWKMQGRKIDVNYTLLKDPIEYKDLIGELLAHQLRSGAFNKRGRANQGYLFQLTTGQYEILMSHIAKEDFPKSLKERKEEMDAQEFFYKIEEEKQFKKINENAEDIYTDDEIAKLALHKKKHKDRHHSDRIHTDEKLKRTRIFKANFNCEIDNCHKTFMNSTNEHQFMECHHLIPVKASDDFSFELDQLCNLVALCPICHAQAHYGNKRSKEEIFNRMYLLRKKELKEIGITKEKMKEIFFEYYL